MGPIGVFDSGYGGLTVLNAVREHLPNYEYIYLGDNARAPYGSRSFDVVHEFTWQAVEFLFKQGCPLIIIACNTASAKALRTIQQTQLLDSYSGRRVLGVIRPSTETIGEWTKSNHVGILGTLGTIQSCSYIIELEKYSPQITTHQLACPMWVPLIENNYHNTDAGRAIIREDVDKLLSMSADIDTIVLACTHYPIIENQIKELVGPKVKVFSQGQIVAKKLKEYLERHTEIDNLLSKSGKVSYITTENTEVFNDKAFKYLGLEIQSLHTHL